MKVKTILTIIGAVAILSGSYNNAKAQRCDKQKYCVDYYDDFDYRTQSVFAHLLPGDTSVVKTVVYSNKLYRIFACMKEEYGQIHFKIVQPYRVTEKNIKKIVYDTSYTYKVDEYGEEIYDDDGNPIVDNMDVTTDTLWDIKRVTKEKLLYDSEQAENPYWQARIKKTKRIFIYVYVPENVNVDGDCVAVYIGRKALSRTKFQGKGHDYDTGD